MKCFRRSLSLLLCFVLLSIVFSFTANAEEKELNKFSITSKKTLSNAWSQSFPIEVTHTPFDTNDTTLVTNTIDRAIPSGNLRAYVKDVHTYFNNDGSPLIKVKNNSAVTFTFTNIYSSNLYTLADGSMVYDRDIEEVYILIVYTNGSSEYVRENISLTKTVKNMYDIEFTHTLATNVNKIEVHLQNNYTLSSAATKDIRCEYNTGEVQLVWGLSVDIPTKSESLLSGIIEWLKGIKDGITNVFSSITEGFSNLGNFILELPQKIWGFIENGLKSLFVPDEQFITEFKEDIDFMLGQKLGAVYQVIDITFESWDRISASDEQDTINFPKVTLNLPENAVFEFGGYDVKIVPDGFSVVVTALKTIVGILCSILFINGLRKRYDEVMGG